MAYSHIAIADLGLSNPTCLQLLDAQLQSRLLDVAARQLKKAGKGFYTIGSSGHEGNAGLGHSFSYENPAFLHYRSGAFMLARAQQMPNLDYVYDILLSLVSAKTDPIAGGRHKVFGSLPLNVPPQTSTIASHLPKAVGCALGIARQEKNQLVLCSFGDASVNHASAQSAFNTAKWLSHNRLPLPLLFICEDNGLGISVKTPPQWIAESFSQQKHLHYLVADGLNVFDVIHQAKKADALARIKKQPVFLHLKLIRLLGHAGSDIEAAYRTQEAIERTQADDPLLHTARELVQQGICSTKDIAQRYAQLEQDIQIKTQQALQQSPLTNAAAIAAAVIPPQSQLSMPPLKTTQQRDALFAAEAKQLAWPRHMAQLINFALIDILAQYPSTLLFGEDVAQKGGVYNVTKGLYRKFGGQRVFNTLLDETSILGTAIGLSMQGFLPMPEIQFFAYLHNAEDQLRGEAATLSFFSQGQYANPMVIRIPSFAYQKGFGGHFHNDNSIAVLRDIPGIIIACPSSGLDAVRMLREALRLAFEERRIVVFLEPIGLYMTKDLHTANDGLWMAQYPSPERRISLGEIGLHGDKSAETYLISYGNGYYLSRQAQLRLDSLGIPCGVLDLRWLAPLSEAAIIKAVKQAKHIIIVDECRRTGSLSEALVTLFVEKLSPLPNIKRLTAEDCFIPIGNTWQHILPSCDDIVELVKKQHHAN